MLVLSRKTQQQIQIGPHITITILKVKGEAVRIGIEAPQDVCVLRSEVAGKLAQQESVSGEAEATVRSALAANEREQARAARIAATRPPVARRSARLGYSSTFEIGRSSLRAHLAARGGRATSGTVSNGTLGGVPLSPVLSGTLEMSAR
ncbi:MAG TPA: carbon storage regulator [Pirellulales bacterium]|nr:carbon storage regulator [Pirellulales bacterium]